MNNLCYRSHSNRTVQVLLDREEGIALKKAASGDISAYVSELIRLDLKTHRENRDAPGHSESACEDIDSD